MQYLINFLCFVFGIISTLAVLIYWAWYLGMKYRIRVAEKARTDIEDAIKDFSKQQKEVRASLRQNLAKLDKRKQGSTSSVDPETSVSLRLKKAAELAAMQAKIDVRKGPEFVMHHNELELEKLSLLKTILADGFDPVITLLYDSGGQEMLLSAYIQNLSKGLA